MKKGGCRILLWCEVGGVASGGISGLNQFMYSLFVCVSAERMSFYVFWLSRLLCDEVIAATILYGQ